jgi:hypothetical protein
LALLAKVDQSGLSKLERGTGHRLGPVPLARIAEVLGLSLEELLCNTV